jgi:protein SCO1/2
MDTQPPRTHWESRPSRVPWKLWLGVLFVAALVIGGELYWLKSTRKTVKRELPVLAQVPDFSFTTETGATLTKKDLAGKIWIADFIFTRCTGPCPMMTDIMRQLQTATRLMARGNVQLISVTVDPAYDTSKVLSAYGGKIGSNPDRWSFLTGDPARIQEFITKGMLLGLSKDGEGMPVHAQKFAVVDREGYIRAYHDLTDAALVPLIVSDVEALDRERRTPKEKKK